MNKASFSKMKLTEKEHWEFAHWLISKLDADGHPYPWWLERFIEEILVPKMKIETASIPGTKWGKRKCFGGYTPAIKICRELCTIRSRCEILSSHGEFRRCVQCTRLAVLPKKYCYYHQAMKDNNERRIRKERIAKGLCQLCGKDNDNKNRLAVKGRHPGRPLTLCSKCREHIRELQKIKKEKHAILLSEPLGNSNIIVTAEREAAMEAEHEV